MILLGRPFSFDEQARFGTHSSSEHFWKSASYSSRDGVAALNLNEVARLVGMQMPSLYKYFSNKFALYDTLFQMGVRLFCESEP